MEGKIQTIKFVERYKENNVYEISLDNGTTAKAYFLVDSFKDKKAVDGTAIGEEMHYEMSAKGNFSKVSIGKPYSASGNGSHYNGQPKPAFSASKTSEGSRNF